LAIRINKNLIFYSTFDPTKESQPVSLENLCKDIEAEKLTLPIFQTYIRWTTEKSVELLNFQLNGKAAVAPISINKIENEELAVPQITFIDRVLINQDKIVGKHSVNDGQQRLSCNYKAFIDHEEFKAIFLDITAGKFVINSVETKKSQIPVGKLYNKEDSVFDGFISEHKELQSLEVQRLLTKVRNKFMSYYYTVNYAKDLTETEQLEWFDVLNLAGSRVTGVEVQLTNMLIKGVDFYSEYSKKFIEKLTEESLEYLIVRKETEVSIPLAALNSAYEIVMDKTHSGNFSPIPSDTKAVAMSRSTVSQLREMFNITLEGLDKAITFVCDNKLLIERIDYLTYLTGLFVYNKNIDVNKEQNGQIIKWFNSVSFKDKGNTERREIFDKLLLIKDVK